MTKRAHGPINQIAFMVPDMNAAIEYWTETMQVGPFFVFPQIAFEEADYRGASFVPYYEAAIAYSGDLMVELIKPNGPSIFKEFLDAGRKGVQHLCVFTDDFDAASKEIKQRGGKRVQGGRFADGSCLAYFDMGGPEPSFLEVACLKPEVLNLFNAIKTAGADWDGKTRTISF